MDSVAPQPPNADATRDMPSQASSSAPNSGASPEKSSMVELKNGKVVFKQKPISFEKHSETLQEIIKFRDMLEERSARRANVLTAIPDEYKPVLVKLAHESDKTLSALSKHILQELLPVQDEDADADLPPPLTLNVVESGIKSVLSRNNYGLDGIGGVKAPAAVCAWRWEAKPAFLDWLPKNGKEKAEHRMAERLQAKRDLKAMFDLLSKEEQEGIMDPKGTLKAAAKDGNSHAIDLTGGDLKSPSQPTKKKKEDEENDDSNSAPKVARPKKVADSEKIAKEKEKLEKKAAKAEREQREKDAQNKSRSILKNFFKPGNTARPAPAKAVDSDKATSSSDISQFQKTFKPFVVKKDTTVAPVNWFHSTQKTVQRKPLTYDGNVIVIDDEDNARPDTEMEVDLGETSAQDRLRSALQKLPPSLRPRARASQLNNISVRETFAQLNEAEVANDVEKVRSIISQFSDRTLFPAKVFIFADDARPGYFGTWTRSSRIIRPRKPFAKDVVVFDYGYDSGEEWEEEPSGEADDVVEDGEEEEGEAEDADSDLDSWLVEDDDEPVTPVEDRGASPVFAARVPSSKRKAESDDSNLAKKRKVVVPLVPFAKGPCWEETVGECDDTFKPYRIQLFNDTPFPIDPFTFVSQCGDIRELKRANKEVFAVPSLPDRLVAPTPLPHTDSAQPLVKVKRTAPAPKTVFPDAHMALLLQKITSAQIASLPVLVEAIYQELRDHKVKKNSIEAKIKEVGEKCRTKKIWVVKDSFRVPV